MRGRADVTRMLAEEFAHHLAQRAPAGATLALEHERDLGLLVGMLHSPGQPVDGVGVNVIVARGHHFEDVLAHIAPVATLWRHAPAGPKIELAVDDERTSGLEDDARILSPV